MIAPANLLVIGAPTSGTIAERLEAMIKAPLASSSGSIRRSTSIARFVTSERRTHALIDSKNASVGQGGFSPSPQTNPNIFMDNSSLPGKSYTDAS
jgi:hypothetical protein